MIFLWVYPTGFQSLDVVKHAMLGFAHFLFGGLYLLKSWHLAWPQYATPARGLKLKVAHYRRIDFRAKGPVCLFQLVAYSAKDEKMGKIMEWTAPAFEEICLHCEINSYASAKL